MGLIEIIHSGQLTPEQHAKLNRFMSMHPGTNPAFDRLVLMHGQDPLGAIEYDFGEIKHLIIKRRMTHDQLKQLKNQLNGRPPAGELLLHLLGKTGVYQWKSGLSAEGKANLKRFASKHRVLFKEEDPEKRWAIWKSNDHADKTYEFDFSSLKNMEFRIPAQWKIAIS